MYNKKMDRKDGEAMSLLYTILIYTAGIAIGFYMLFIVPTQWLKINRAKRSLGIGIKVLQISDLHVDMLRISASKLKESIELHKPQYIFITGDFTSRPQALPKLDYYLHIISSCKIPVYAVLGNHDYRLPDLAALLQLFDKHQICLLRNEHVVLEHFVLVGIDDDCSRHSDWKQAFHNSDSANKRILIITHDPNIFLSIQQPYDYAMAGHLHGKQFNLPFLFRLKPKGELAKRGIYRGMHKGEYGVFYISSGIGQAGINARFGVRSEITVHYL